MGRGSRAFKNTIYMYARTGIQIIVNLYAVRILLQNLGIYDYGLYNTIGSIVVMSSFVTSAMSESTQRYISFALGESDSLKLATTIRLAKQLHFILGIIVVVACEVIGHIFIYNYMSVEPYRRFEAFVVLQFSIFTFFSNVILVPYRSVLISYERFDAISVITIIEAFNKLVIAFAVGIWFIWSRLVTYAFLFGIITIITFLITYGFYYKYRLPDRGNVRYHKELRKGMIGFSGWNFLGGFGQVLVTQLSNMFMNMFCGPAVNAAQGVANQVNSVVSRFVQDFMSAVYPQITKSFSAGDYEYLEKITYSSIKLSFFLICAISIPLAYNIDYILSVWLHEVPRYVPDFIKLLMVNSCILSLTGSISALVEANGKIKYTQINYTIVMFFTALGGFFLLKEGYSPNVVYYMLILSTIGSMFVRLYFAARYKLIDFSHFVRMIFKDIIPLIVCYIGVYYIIFNLFVSNICGLPALILSCVVSTIFLSVYGYFVFLSTLEKNFLKSLIKKH